MPVIKQNKIHENDLVDNERVTYVYYENEKHVGGDSLTKMLRRSLQLNSFPLIVKKRGGVESTSWISDEECNYYIPLFDKRYDIIVQRLQNSCVVVIPIENILSAEYSETYFDKYSSKFIDHIRPKMTHILKDYEPRKFIKERS